MAAGDEGRARNEERWETPRQSRPEWLSRLAAFRPVDHRRAVWQLANTLIPYAGLWYVMVLLFQRGVHPAVILLLAIPAAGLLVRVFVLFHDCVHGSFFRSARANRIAGYLLGALAYTSFDAWRFEHLRHHANQGNLDARGFGDVWTMTLDEYKHSARWPRWRYRLYRNPPVMLALGAVFTFMLVSRFPLGKGGRRERWGVLLTDLLMAALFAGVAWAVGWRAYLLIQLPVLWLAAVAGIWLFYVQHQFEGVYWRKSSEWDRLQAAMEGCSFYRLPQPLRWLTGNIGYHHIHHLNARIPNYRLKRCYDAIPELHSGTTLSIAESIACARLKLWDETQQKLVPFP